jgi:hypothetical protein
MPKDCPECGREMKAVTSRTPDGAWHCDYCLATWTPVDVATEFPKPECPPGPLNEDTRGIADRTFIKKE